MREFVTHEWIACPPVRTVSTAGLSLDDLVALLEQSATPETATACGEIKGLYGAYKLAPSTALLETIVAKCLELLLKSRSAAPVVATSRKPAFLEDVWVSGFEYFLEVVCGKSEKTTAVYVRAIKRIMKSRNLTIKDLVARIDDLIAVYDGNDQASHNVHISALRRFKEFILDPCGFVFTVSDQDGEWIESRVYCTWDKVEADYRNMAEEYAQKGQTLKAYDKFGNLLLY